MNTRTNSIADLIQNFRDEERAVLVVGADAAAQKISQARHGVSATLAAAKDTCSVAQKKAVATAQAADKALRHNPYRAIGSAFCVGFALGFILTRQLR
jgi:ElaB/YqjD/DUF883 family membrane-anchored ribosome-binding protein